CGELRDESIHAHAVTFHALGLLGFYLLNNEPKWHNKLKGLQKINWSRQNSDWNRRCVNNKSMTNNRKAAELTCIQIKAYLKIPLTDKEKSVEKSF
ncbi:DNA sulfur modification protein DndB, partial [Salmonella sp. ZJHZ19_0056]|uniref:DNA sulfur modification protein DndB n=1 Tax=Salmonella sp. ZJHZ19_0056 TaxID=3159584 RepID=UPI0039797CB6